MTRYLGSTKNLAGSALGLVGVLLYVFGVVGSYWPLVVIGLYGAGALLAPADRRLASATSELDQARTELAAVVSYTDRLPAEAGDFLRRIEQILTDMLDRPAAFAANPDLLHRVVRVARTDLPTSVHAYLDVPSYLAREDELRTQLDLLEYEAHQIAVQFYSGDINRQADHTRYLRDRES